MHRGSRPFPYAFARFSRLQAMQAMGLEAHPSSHRLRHLSQESSASSLDALFKRAVEHLASPHSATQKAVSNEDKLRLYALFKQSEQGPCQGSRPGLFDPVGRAKFDAWQALGDVPKEQAKKMYVQTVARLLGELPPAPPASASPATLASPSPASPFPSPPAPPASLAPSLRALLSYRQQPPASAPAPPLPPYRTLRLTLSPQGVAHVELHRPHKANAFDMEMWGELRHCLDLLAGHAGARVVLLSGGEKEREEGKGGVFSTGMDLQVFTELLSLSNAMTCEGRKREALGRFITYLQACVSSLERCPLPVIAAIEGKCIGGAVDLICAADIRLCTEDAVFCIKEIDLAIVADMGTLQRLPKLIGTQRTAELALTGRDFSGLEAKSYGLVLDCHTSRAALFAQAYGIAQSIAEKSPLTVRGVKQSIVFARDHAVKQGLEQVKEFNSSRLMSNDLLEAMESVMKKRTPHFKDS